MTVSKSITLIERQNTHNLEGETAVSFGAGLWSGGQQSWRNAKSSADVVTVRKQTQNSVLTFVSLPSTERGRRTRIVAAAVNLVYKLQRSTKQAIDNGGAR